MTAVIYPISFQRRFERDGAKGVAQDAGPAPARTSSPEGTDTCTCGHTVTAPYSSNYSAKTVVNKWHCSACGARWKTTADIWRC
jgi:hypothetical protein